jgi:hypothetical protein
MMAISKAWFFRVQIKKNFKKYNFLKTKFLNYYILVFFLPSIQWTHHLLPLFKHCDLEQRSNTHTHKGGVKNFSCPGLLNKYIIFFKINY